MTKLSKIISKDYRVIQSRANAHFAVCTYKVGRILSRSFEDIWALVSYILMHCPERLEYHDMHRRQLFRRLDESTRRILDQSADQIGRIWQEDRDTFNLLGRIGLSFLDRKSTPPWIKTKLNLAKVAKEGKFSPRKGTIKYTLDRLGIAIVQEIRRAAINSETPFQALQRVKRIIPKTRIIGKESAWKTQQPDQDEFDNYDDTVSSLKGPVDIDLGYFTEADIEAFYQDMITAKGWDYRGYQSWFSDALKSRNAQLRDLEQLLMGDAVEQMNSGMLTIAGDSAGVEDLEWVTQQPKTCDECTDRNGLTTSEISSKIKDEYEDQPPPLHPNCRCEYAPKLKDDWLSGALEKQGMSFDPEDGNVYQADEIHQAYGGRDMTLDEYTSTVLAQAKKYGNG